MIINLINSNKTLASAINEANKGDIILLDNKEYYEKLIISKENLTLIGNGNSAIYFDAYHGKINPLTNKKYGTTGSATVRVLASAKTFKAYNITFKNTFIRNGIPQGQAVAFKAECECILDNCKFISLQDTLYLDCAKNDVVNNCYIEGDIDYIFGSANVLFTNCEISSVKNSLNIAYVTAPNTLKSNDKGFVFDNCNFYSNNGITSYIGRPWYPGEYIEEPYPKLTINNSNFYGNFIYELKTMHEGDPVRHTLSLSNIKKLVNM